MFLVDHFGFIGEHSQVQPIADLEELCSALLVDAMTVPGYLAFSQNAIAPFDRFSRDCSDCGNENVSLSPHGFLLRRMGVPQPTMLHLMRFAHQCANDRVDTLSEHSNEDFAILLTRWPVCLTGKDDLA
jgi:hypothetical protein